MNNVEKLTELYFKAFAICGAYAQFEASFNLFCDQTFAALKILAGTAILTFPAAYLLDLIEETNLLILNSDALPALETLDIAQMSNAYLVQLLESLCESVEPLAITNDSISFAQTPLFEEDSSWAHELAFGI